MQRGKREACHHERVVERSAAMLDYLPMFLDDTKRARKPEEVGKTLFDYASGVGRGRGPGGCRRRGTRGGRAGSARRRRSRVRGRRRRSPAGRRRRGRAAAAPAARRTSTCTPRWRRRRRARGARRGASPHSNARVRGQRLRRRSPIRRVTFSASKCSASGIEYLRVVPQTSFHACGAISRLASRYASSRALSAATASASA